jgi:hypothetical protein
MLPGCLVAGAGLGLTNTPVTNTTTAAVPSTRAGMASGIDTSARMISLAINIALMGFILVAPSADLVVAPDSRHSDRLAERPISGAPPPTPAVPVDTASAKSLGDKIDEHPDSRWHVGAANEHRVDLLDVTRIEGLQHRHKATGG